MYDDYEIDYSYNNELYAYDLDEICEHYGNITNNTQDAYEIDDEYARDSCDYGALAYKHYAGYHIHITHRITRIMYAQARKRHVCVTLDIECYDDLYLEDLDWKRLLDLQGDEEVHTSIKDLDPFGGLGRIIRWHNDALKPPNRALGCFRTTFNPELMCGPAFEYTFQDFINDASDEEWDAWECEAARLELPLDYYIQEFVGQSGNWHIGGCAGHRSVVHYIRSGGIPMVFLTLPHYGCVFTLSQEDGDELYYAPIYADGSVNLQEFAPVDMDSVDMDDMEIFDIRNRLAEMCQV